MHFAKLGEKVKLVDLDIVNPYFRSADFIDKFKDSGIQVVSPIYANTNLDIPALGAEIDGAIFDKNSRIIVDVGGDDTGAVALGRYSSRLRKEVDFSMLYVVNRYRHFAKDIEDATNLLYEIEAASKLEVNMIVNNSNMGKDTTSEHILNSIKFADDIKEKTGLPVLFTTVPNYVDKSEITEIKNIFSVEIFVKPPWEI